jgi:hypothetical protein
MGTRLTSSEGTIKTLLGTSSSMYEHNENIENQGIASEQALVNCTVLTTLIQFDSSASHV